MRHNREAESGSHHGGREGHRPTHGGYDGHGAMDGHDPGRGHHAGHHDHHAHMVADFRRRFWVSLALTVPILALAPLIQQWLGLDIAFRGDRALQWALATVVYLYGGWPFGQQITQEHPGDHCQAEYCRLT